VSYFIVYGRNFGSEEVKINDAYIISGIDSSKLQFKINSIPDGYIDIEKASPVPVGADITLQVIFGNGFMPETEFRKKWDEFYVVVETDNQKIRRLVDRSFIHRFLDANHPDPTSAVLSDAVAGNRRNAGVVAAPLALWC